MEENKSLYDSLDIDPNTEVDVFIDDKITTITMNGIFVKRLLLLGDWMVKQRKPEEILAIYDKLSEEQELTDIFEINIQTFLILMGEIEKCGKEQGSTKKMKMSEVRESSI